MWRGRIYKKMRKRKRGDKERRRNEDGRRRWNGVGMVYDQ